MFRCKGANVGLATALTSRLTASGVDRTRVEVYLRRGKRASVF